MSEKMDVTLDHTPMRYTPAVGVGEVDEVDDGVDVRSEGGVVTGGEGGQGGGVGSVDDDDGVAECLGVGDGQGAVGGEGVDVVAVLAS